MAFKMRKNLFIIELYEKHNVIPQVFPQLNGGGGGDMLDTAEHVS